MTGLAEWAAIWDGYATDPDRYVCSEHDTTAPTIDRVAAAMPATGTVLDVGCGQGRVAVPLAERGLTVVGCDISSAMIAAAARHPRVTYLLTDGLTVLGPADGAYSVLLFQHLAPATVRTYLRSLAGALNRGAPLLIQFVAGDVHEGLDHRYPPPEFARLAVAAGFVDVEVTQAVHPDWWWLTARSAT